MNDDSQKKTLSVVVIVVEVIIIIIILRTTNLAIGESCRVSQITLGVLVNSKSHK
jgi:hypothetical protein